MDELYFFTCKLSYFLTVFYQQYCLKTIIEVLRSSNGLKINIPQISFQPLDQKWAQNQKRRVHNYEKRKWN